MDLKKIFTSLIPKHKVDLTKIQVQAQGTVIKAADVKKEEKK